VTEITVIQQDNTLHLTKTDAALTVTAAGPQGVQGPTGPAGTPGGSAFEHLQVVASNSWVLSHNLNRKVHVSIFDALGNLVFADVEHGDLNTTTITFAAPVTGSAVIS
jgi:hypothetical protein